MKNHKKMRKSRTQKVYNMKGCSSLAKSKKGGRKWKMGWGAQKGGCGCGGSLQTGGKTRRYKKMLAYPASNNTSQSSFAKGYLAYSPQNGGQNPNLPYGQTPPFNNVFPDGVSQPQNLRGGGDINEAVIYGPVNNYGGKRRRRGGSNGMWPDGLVGSPWGAQVPQWPGVDRISGDRNYLAHNNYLVDPQTQGVINGRALSGGKTRKHRGGFLPQDLVNMGRQVAFGLGSTYNALVGVSAPVNPLPYKDQLVGKPTLSSLQLSK
jgi:hypothetical protein